MEEKKYQNYEIMVLDIEILKRELTKEMESLNPDLEYINDLIVYGCWGEDNLKQTDEEKDSLLETAYVLLHGRFYDNYLEHHSISEPIGYRFHKVNVIDNSLRHNYYGLIKEIKDKLNDDYFTEEDILIHPRGGGVKSVIETCMYKMGRYNSIENESQNNEYTLLRDFLINFLSINKREINQLKSDHDILLGVIRNKNYELFTFLLPHNHNINKQNGSRGWGRSYKTIYGSTALMEASHNGQLEMVKDMLKIPNINVNSVEGNRNFHALACAVSSNNLDIVKELLKHPDIKPNLKFEHSNGYRGDTNMTALYLALLENRMDIARELLKHPKINPFLDVDNYNNNILENLLKPENFDVLKSILNNRKKSTNKDYFFNSMLISAVVSSSLDAFKEIIKISDVYNQINVNRTLTNYVNNDCSIEIVKILLNHPNSNLGSGILLNILNRINNVEIIQAILDYPSVDPNLKGSCGRTALIEASTQGHLQVVQALLKHPNIDPNLQDSIGNNALIDASSRGHSQVVEELLKHPNIDPNLQAKEGNTALHFASSHNESEKHLQVVQSLLSYPKTDPNIQNEYGSTALICATAHSSPEIVEELLKHPLIDVTIKTDKGSNAWDFARQEIRDRFSQLNVKHNLLQEMKEFSESLSKEQKERFLLLLQKVEEQI